MVGELEPLEYEVELVVDDITIIVVVVLVETCIFPRDRICVKYQAGFAFDILIPSDTWSKIPS